MLTQLPVFALIGIFILSAAIVWFAGITLAKSTATLSDRFKLGKALGGMILLAIITDLPEVAITCGGVLRHNFGLVTGNLLGGVAMQTTVLVILDAFGDKKKYPLTSRLKNLTPILEGLMVIMLLVATIMISQLPHGLLKGRVTVGDVLIISLWIAGLWMIQLSRDKVPWEEKPKQEIQQVNRDTECQQTDDNDEANKKLSQVLFAFAWSSIATFLAGYVLEESSDALAHHFGLSSMLFGATFLALATSLPEMTTGLASVKMGEYELAMSDIMGGNAFLPVLFPLGTLIAGQSPLSQTSQQGIYMACLGILLTVVYMIGIIFHPTKKVLKLGLDSLIVLAFYLVGIVLLSFMPS